MPITMVRAIDGAIIYETEASRAMMLSEGPGGSTRSRWLTPAARQEYVEHLRRFGMVDNWERQFRRGDGTLVWLALSARMITYRGEEVIVATAYDLTERRAAQEELERQREIAQQAEKLGALGELLAGISHELNNPLSVLVGQAAILRETTRDAAVGRRVEKIAEAADRCARIVRSFLAMARQGPALLDRVDVNAVVHSGAEIALAQINESGAALELHLARGLPMAWADADQIRQVVVNLLVNAAHALRDFAGPRRIEMETSAQADGTLLRIDVADSGPGVPANIRSRVFEPLFTTKQVGQGTGIGLTLCHRIVSAHGGRIQLLSPPEGGALLRVELPAAPAAAAVGTDVVEEEAVGALRILVVDDDVAVSQTTSEVLALDGHSVDCAASAEEAMGMIRRRRYDIVITDVRMPGTDGLQFHAALARDRPDVADRLVFATGDMLSPQLARALRATGRPCLEKPFLPSDVRAILDALM
ncbi:MAG: response regulator [Alphaproteobacteria bacterium]